MLRFARNDTKPGIFERGIRGVYAAVLVAVAAAPLSASDGMVAPLPAAADPARIARLNAHGLTTSPQVLVGFLEQGFPRGADPAAFPAAPALKSQIVVDAIVECARLRTREAAPILAHLAHGFASVGVRDIIEGDLGRQPPGDREALRRQISRTIRLNAVVALGLIGDRGSMAVLREVFEGEKDPAFKTPAALALATLGSPEGLGYLVREIRRAKADTSAEAARALQFITGLDYGPPPDAPVAQRRTAAGQWKAWWETHGKTFVPHPNHVLARRLAPPVQSAPREPQTVRDLLHCIAYPGDRRWMIDGYIAYERLRAIGGAVYKPLERIIGDKQENLKIRRQAMLQYVQTSTAGYANRSSDQAKRAYRIIRRQRWDRNPEIREIVRECTRRLRGK